MSNGRSLLQISIRKSLASFSPKGLAKRDFRSHTHYTEDTIFPHCFQACPLRSLSFRVDEYHVLSAGKACPATPETLEAGRHLLPFNVYLTPEIPSSYEGPCGWVRYYVEALLTTPRQDKSVRTKKYFAVIRDLDLDTVKFDKVSDIVFSSSSDSN